MSTWPKSDLVGVSIFYINTQVVFCQMTSQPASQQAIWQNVKLTLNLIFGGVYFYINTQVVFWQMTSQPASQQAIW